MANVARLVLRAGSRTYGAFLACFTDTRPFFEPAEFPWAKELEAHTEEIRAELLELLHGQRLPSLVDVLPGEEEIGDDLWKVFLFRVWGKDVEENRRLCPRTSELLDDVPEMTTAFFSILEPGKHVPPHRGPFRGVLRYHLGLLIPPPPDSCRIRVGTEIRTWQEGESLIFDDTIEHEVWNDSDQPRVVLFLDIKRRLPLPIRWINNAMIYLLAQLINRTATKFEKAGAKPAQAGHGA